MEMADIYRANDDLKRNFVIFVRRQHSDPIKVSTRVCSARPRAAAGGEEQGGKPESGHAAGGNPRGTARATTWRERPVFAGRAHPSFASAAGVAVLPAHT